MLEEVHTQSKLDQMFERVLTKVNSLFKHLLLSKKTELAVHASYVAILVMALFWAINFFRTGSPVAFLVLLLVSQSVLVEWTRLYHNAMAKKMSIYSRTAPIACENVRELSHLQSVLLWFSSTFSLKGDECHHYYSRILVDPLTEISVLEAFSSAVRRFLGNYLIDAATVINSSILSLLSNLPVQWQLIVFFAVLTTTILVALIYTGIEVRSPLLGVKVSNQHSAVCNTDNELRMIQVIKETVKEEFSRNLEETRDELCKSIVEELNQSMMNENILNSTKLD